MVNESQERPVSEPNSSPNAKENTRQIQSVKDQGSEIQLDMESQSFQDEYADEASAEMKALEQDIKPPVPVSKPPTPEAPVQKKQKKLSEPGDLGGTNGTHTISEAPPQNEKKSE